MIKAAIIGATGYVGAELVRILLSHPEVERIYASSVSFEGQRLDEIYPAFAGQLEPKCDGRLVTAEEAEEKADIVFTALPHGLAELHALYCTEHGKRLIDMSADFRYGDDEATFKAWYKKSWEHPALHKESVYGLPEMNRGSIRRARIVGNPGCYVTSALLALLPALKSGIVDTGCIIVDSASGITGSGRQPKMSNQFCECGESFSAYSVGCHRHQSEIARNCSALAGRAVGVVFTPHLLPISRGILSTIYAPLTEEAAERAARNPSFIRALYEAAFAGEPFVRVLPEGITAATKNVRFTNFCDIQLYVVNGGKMLELTSCLDNMVKGAAGQAVENMNIMFGFPETEALDFVPAAF